MGVWFWCTLHTANTAINRAVVFSFSLYLTFLYRKKKQQCGLDCAGLSCKLNFNGTIHESIKIRIDFAARL